LGKKKEHDGHKVWERGAGRWKLGFQNLRQGKIKNYSRTRRDVIVKKKDPGR